MSDMSMDTGMVGCALPPPCGVETRRERLRESGQLNGIDYVEVGDDGRSLCVHLFGAIPEGIGVQNVRISGGDRITGLQAVSVTPEYEPQMHDDPCLRVVLDREGDHTPYCLCLVDTDAGADSSTWHAYPGFDPRYACVTLYFRLGCARERDCAAKTPCVPAAVPEPEINYLAKDYASFRQLFLDRLALDLPDWQERHVPDLGIALVETLAYTGDHLSYYQDAVATEAYLATARRRISVRRHARLVDYRMHEGCNARALVTLATDTDLELPLDQLLLLVPPPGQADAEPGLIDATQLEVARAQGALVFEPMLLDGSATVRLANAHNAIRLHTWGDEQCCLPRGSTRATLVDPGLPGTPGENTLRNAAAQRALQLAVGDLLILEEVKGVRTGQPADADPTHRHAVRLTAVLPRIDPLDRTLLLEVSWDACDALPFDLHLSGRLPAPDCGWLHDVAVARGNVVLVDHGERVRLSCDCAALCEPGTHADYPGLDTALAAMPDACTRCDTLTDDCWLVPGTTAYGCCGCDGAVLDVARPPSCTGHRLPVAPLTWAEPLPMQAPVCQLLARDPRRALPQLAVYGGPLANVLVTGTPGAAWRWEARQDLLESGPDDRHYVVEVDDEGVAQLRFGDGTLGRQPQAGDFFRASPRIGNGAIGNVGHDSIVWLALKSGGLSGAVIRPRNPIAASGGTEPETLAEVKLYAPGAFRAHPLRAIVADDYAAFAARTPGVQGAACGLAWNGSWYEADVVIDPLGRDDLPAGMAAGIAGELECYRRIGHDVAVRPARYVPLLIELFVCVRPEFLAAQVLSALHDRFTAGLRSDGLPGFFHPDRLVLGAPVHASLLLAEAQAIAGVAHVELRTLTRMEGGHPGKLPADGVLWLGAGEIAQVDNDPDHPDHGSIAFDIGGGR
ncbi:putative baseplate assembly protein [Dyella sp. BiH032]|uniref:putative baseplate assembly protein n=1 Tax=Dyella sp. BiH032 TaxID=3075430 RepID=UPI0028932F63|nr:putative baseplate assembly protein [Dyella sp. BiH032]WNL45690.1 putative baseplate assembly protein [Dyella sp. BiH032]